jgi:methyl coenzyme M reductase alpha subunit
MMLDDRLTADGHVITRDRLLPDKRPMANMEPGPADRATVDDGVRAKRRVDADPTRTAIPVQTDDAERADRRALTDLGVIGDHR